MLIVSSAEVRTVSPRQQATSHRRPHLALSGPREPGRQTVHLVLTFSLPFDLSLFIESIQSSARTDLSVSRPR